MPGFYSSWMIPGIVLAAGNSSRMGRTKALLAVGGSDTFLSRVVRTLRDGGVGEIVVVVGADAASIRSSVDGASLPVRVVDNPDFEEGQLSSLLKGLHAIDRPGVTAALVTLIDVPLVAPETVRTLVTAFQSGSALIVRPASRGRHGHPVIFDRALFDELRRANPKEGAKQVVRAHAGEILDVEMADEGAFADIDTPEEYERLINPSAR
jgi:molybdenum cofactor cytidylyltransferase